MREYLAICDEEQRKLDQQRQAAAAAVPAAPQTVAVPATPPVPVTTPVGPATSAAAGQETSLAAVPTSLADQAQPDQLLAEPIPAAPPTDGAPPTSDSR